MNIYASNIGAPKYIKKILEDFKKDIDSNTTLLSKIDKKNISMDIVSVNNP